MIIVFVLLGLSAAVLHHYVEKGSIDCYHPLIKAKEFQIKIACIGDSTTYGYDIDNWSRNNFPAVLQKILGNGYCVNNYGCSGRTISSQGDHPYMKEAMYGKSIEFDPDIAIILLGTNDSKPHNLESAEMLKKDYEKLISPFLGSRVIIASPLPALQKRFEVRDDMIRNHIIPVIKRVCKEKGLEYVNIYDAFNNRDELFTDGIHPNKEGAAMIAQIMNDVIKKETVYNEQ